MNPGVCADESLRRPYVARLLPDYQKTEYIPQWVWWAWTGAETGNLEKFAAGFLALTDDQRASLRVAACLGGAHAVRAAVRSYGL